MLRQVNPPWESDSDQRTLLWVAEMSFFLRISIDRRYTKIFYMISRTKAINVFKVVWQEAVIANLSRKTFTMHPTIVCGLNTKKFL